ncbi:MAG TPA: SAM-dependent methyltransferase [Streptosporangiaceae bacterium]|nr:SAM-dependent methyltransferase [Streptosporangiaceae bacterium]
MTEVPPALSGVDTSRPSAARIYDLMLGGCHYFPVDQKAAAKVMDVVPECREVAWANRGFHQRAARWIADQGVSQFLDLGSGLLTVGNTHEVVREIMPDARVVYVDLDPMVARQAGPALHGDPNAVLIQADLRDPAPLLADRQLRGLIDFSQPVGLVLTAVMHFVADGSNPWRLVRDYLAALPPGSYLALSHGTSDGVPPLATACWQDVYADANVQFHPRPQAAIAGFFDGLELVPPYEAAEATLVHLGLWGCEDPALADSDSSRWGYCGVARVG